MPLERPAQTMGGKAFWNVLEKFEGFILQQHRLPSIWPYMPYRILIEANYFQVACAKDKETAYDDWKHLKLIYEAELKASAAKWKTKEEASAGLLEFCTTRFELVGANPAIIDPTKRSPSPNFTGEEMKTMTVIQAATEEPAGKSLANSVIHTSEETRIEGWLAKLPRHDESKSYTSGWTRRYFILKRGCLFYYDTQLKGTLNLDADFKISVASTATPATLNKQKFGYTFALALPSPAASVTFALETQAELNAWTSALHSLRMSDVITHPAAASTTAPFSPSGTVSPPSSASTSPVATSSLSGAASPKSGSMFKSPSNHNLMGSTGAVVERRGWLFMQFTGEKDWKYRYCIMNNKTLEYYDAQEKGYCPLLNGEVERVSTQASTFRIKYSTKGGTKVLVLRAMDAEVMEAWMQALQDDIKQLHAADKDSLNRLKVLEGADAKAIQLMNKVRDILDAENTRIIKQGLVKPKLRKRLNILSFDGGGLRGIMSCIMLERLVAEFPDLLDQFDFVTGTSNGSMIAMALAFGFKPSSARALLEVTAETVLAKMGFRGGLDCSKFTNQYLKLFCDESWGTRKLSDAPKFVLIPALLLDNKHPDKLQRSWQNMVFHNLDGDPTREEVAADVVMRSCAAPTYFPSYQGHVDGGMFAHDPASLALVMSMSRLHKSFDDVCILSMGTGRVQHVIEADQHDWGMMQWVGWMPSMLWDGMVQKSETVCTELIGPRYHRINPHLEREVALDDHAQIPIMTQIGYGVDLSPTIRWLKEHVYSHVEK